MVLGNWKMNTARSEAMSIAAALQSHAESNQVIVGIAPPFPWIDAIRTLLAGTDIRIGAQTCAAMTDGAFTGEVSASMLAELCDFVLVGHSERRRLFGETDAVVREKLLRIIEAGLIPILCVGETLEHRQAGNAEDVVRRQLDAALSSIPPDQIRQMVVAYEPVWAIGTGHTASPHDASALCLAIAQRLADFELPDIPVLYGGSVSPGNADALIAVGGIDGFLVGGASLNPQDFYTIIAAATD